MKGEEQVVEELLEEKVLRWRWRLEIGKRVRRGEKIEVEIYV